MTTAVIIIIATLFSILMYHRGYRDGSTSTARRWAAMMPEIKMRVRAEEREACKRMLQDRMDHHG